MQAAQPPLPWGSIRGCNVSENSMGKALIRTVGLLQDDIEQAGHRRS